DQDRSALDELLLELIDLVVSAHPVADAAVTFDALDQHASVPRAVEDRDASQRRDIFPEAPQIRIGALLVGRRGHRHRNVLPRIERAGHAPDRAALAGGVDALEDHDQRTLGKTLVTRALGELALVLFEITRVTVCWQLLGQVEIKDELEVVDGR